MTSTRVAQVTGCLPFPVSHLLRISAFIRFTLFKYSIAMILTLVFSSFSRKVLNWTHFVPISTGMLTTLPSVHVKFSSSGMVGLVPGIYAVYYSGTVR